MKRTPAALAISFWLALICPSQERDVFEVVGRILRSNGKPFTHVVPLAFLDCATYPFALRAYADRSGNFRLKGVRQGTYTLTVYVPGVGESRKTIEVGPGTSDAKGKITVDVRLELNLSQDQEHLVSTAQLSIPVEAKRLYLKAESQLEKREVEGATTSLQKAVEIAPRFTEAWNHLGTIAYLTRKYEEAEKYFRKALEQEPEAFAPLVNLGGALLSLERIEEALDVNQRAVRLKPDDPLAQSQLGISYYFLGRYDQAEASLKQAKSLDPGHFTMPQLFLAEIYERRRNVPAAIRELESFLQLHPDSPRALSIRGKLEALRKSQADQRPPPPGQAT